MSKKILRTDYQAPAYEVLDLHLNFDLHEDFCHVTSTARYKKIHDSSSEPLTLDGVDLELVNVKMDGLAYTNYVVTEKNLILQNLPQNFQLEIETRVYPHKNTSLEGLYKSGGHFVTQCEAQGFRKITYFMDRPDVMTKYSVRLEADEKKYPILLSNGDRKSSKKLAAGRHEVHWADPHKKPCYLFALFAGDLGLLKDEFVTRSGRKVNLEVYSTYGTQKRCEHAMRSLKKAMKWDEERFDREYDLNDYMIVAIDDFNAGAMENKGLNIFNSRLVLADPETATDLDFHLVESVVAHEYFHNWTGNRITLRDWFNLSLKEGLTVFRDQEFSGDVTDRGLQRMSDVDTLRERQFPEDAGPNSHPVRPESCYAVDNFFTATIYEKGAEVIRMMQTLAGRKAFKKGMDVYFQKHDGQAVTIDDFAAAISAGADIDLLQFKSWYSRPGTPVLHVTENWDQKENKFELKVTQNQADPLHIPVQLGLLDQSGHEISLQAHPQIAMNSDQQPVYHLKTTESVLTFKNLKTKPYVSFLRDFSAPVIVNWDRPLADLLFLMAHDKNLFSRREAALTAAQQIMNQNIKNFTSSKPLEVSPDYLQAWSHSLMADLNPAAKCQLLSLPSDLLLLQYRTDFNAEAFTAVRKFIVQHLALLNRHELLGVYQKWNRFTPQDYSFEVAGQRSLKNLALSLLVAADQKEANDLAWTQYQKSASMTDRMMALSLLIDADDLRADEACADFHQRYKTDKLILNKWFSVQALGNSKKTFERVKKLVQHADFDVKNPNNVYSLLRNFGHNLCQFHSGLAGVYEFYFEQIARVDALNPQVAARLCSVFGLIQKLDQEKQQTLKSLATDLLKNKNLSANSKEILEPLTLQS